LLFPRAGSYCYYCVVVFGFVFVVVLLPRVFSFFSELLCVVQGKHLKLCLTETFTMSRNLLPVDGLEHVVAAFAGKMMSIIVSLRLAQRHMLFVPSGSNWSLT
jgi:hypothetical protein